MSVKLVLLGMLRRGPRYGYELKTQIEREMGDWTSIAFGSIYFALKKLCEEGFVRKNGQEQQGNRPSRIIYEITEAGNSEFRRLLSEQWNTQGRTYFPFDIALYFIRELPGEECRKALEGRIREIEHGLKYVRAHRDTELSNPHVPPVADAIFSHSLCHLEAELSWLKDMKIKLESGAFD